MQNLGERHTGYVKARRTPMAVWYILAAFVGALLGIVFLVVAYPEALSTLGGGPAGNANSTQTSIHESPASSGQPGSDGQSGQPGLSGQPGRSNAFGAPGAGRFADPRADSRRSQAGLIAANEAITTSRRTSIVSAVERAGPAVVSIVATFQMQRRGFSPMFDDPFFGHFVVPRLYTREEPNTGSGVIIDEAGYIVTNAHVVRLGDYTAGRIRAVLTDGRSLACTLVGVDVMSDLAVLHVQGVDLPVAALGRSDDIMTGEWAITIGNPLGLAVEDAQPAVAVGVVSALGRNFRRQQGSRTVYRDMIQTDATINPGNSGGPLVNAFGEVIGINTFILSESGGSEGVGFAIPIDRVRRVADELIQYGGTRRGWTGLSVIDITEYVAQELNIVNRQGVLVNEIDPDSPADAAGILVMDVIRKINGEVVASYPEAREALYGSLVGDSIELEVERDGRLMPLVLHIAEL
ncbi:MAG: trypsin-like serine protease [Gemmatimonadetes bacterium]|nr:trypsin-like serine protease [Gemmatimonadota bacterium]MYG17907.1 trypsin-like serine protease [Gemmatimonadota bacterium]